MGRSSMRSFWDRRALEDPFFFVDNRLDYRDPDMARFWASGEEIVDTFCEQLGVSLSPTDRVVDIGCGVGRVTRALSKRAASVEAIDISERMLEVAREQNHELRNVKWLHGDGRTLGPIAAEAVDVCFSHVVFQHIPDPAITLGYVRETGRVLRAGGWAAFQISNDPAIHVRRGRRDRIGRVIRGLLGLAPKGQGHAAWRGSAIDLEDLRSVAARSDLTVERVVGAGTQMCLVLVTKFESPS